MNLPLRDVHAPEAIGWWPPAIGWWALAIAIPLLMALLWWLYRRLTRKTALSEAVKKLADIKANQNLDDLTKLREVSILIRRVAVSIAPRSEVAALTGNAWLAYLDRSLPGSPFADGVGRCLSEIAYRHQVPGDLDIGQLFALCESWLKAQKLS